VEELVLELGDSKMMACDEAKPRVVDRKRDDGALSHYCHIIREKGPMVDQKRLINHTKLRIQFRNRSAKLRSENRHWSRRSERGVLWAIPVIRLVSTRLFVSHLC